MTDELALNDAISEILKYSLLSRDANARTLEIHRLVQQAIKQAMTDEEQRSWAERAVLALNEVFPDPTDFRNWPICERFLPQVLTCADLIDKYDLEARPAGLLSSRAGFYLNQRARYADAELFHQRSLAIDQAALGPEDPNVAIDLNNLAELYHNRGEYDKAEPLYQRSLAIKEKVRGSEDRSVALSLNNLALLYANRGEYDKAEPSYQRSLAIAENAYGPAHPSVASALNNLAALYDRRGEYDKAEPLYLRSLAIRRENSGARPPGPRIQSEQFGLSSLQPRRVRQSRTSLPTRPRNLGKRPRSRSPPRRTLPRKLRQPSSKPPTALNKPPNSAPAPPPSGAKQATNSTAPNLVTAPQQLHHPGDSIKGVFTVRLSFALALAAAAANPAGAEVHSFTLQQALEMAARQNPDVTLARLDQRRAEEGVYVALDPFRPKVYAGSGLAYTYGYPNSIDGNAPSIIEVKTQMSIYDRSQRYTLAAARETARGSASGAQAKAEDVAYQAADLFLTASEFEHDSAQITAQIPSLEKVVGVMNASVNEGSELPVEVTRARVNLESAQVRLDSGKLDSDYYEMLLAVALGYPATDRVKPLDSPTADLLVPPSEDEAADSAIRNNRELNQMRSNVLAKQLDLRSYRAARQPKVDLVAQYALFAKYNYEQYFQKFQRNNFQLGASVSIPILVGAAVKGYMAQAQTDMQKIRIQMDQTRNRILSDTRHSYEQWEKAEKLRDLARMQLDLARQDLTVLLAQNGEGRVPLSRVEQARLEESNRWISMYDAETQVTRAKLAILRQTGTLLSAFRDMHPGTLP